MVYWVNRMLWDSKTKDKKKGLYDPEHFITRNYVERIWLFQNQKCHYCEKQMQIKKRNLHDGCTIERLDNNFGHTIKNCVLACWKCNTGKGYAYMWKKKKQQKRERIQKELEKNTEANKKKHS